MNDELIRDIARRQHEGEMFCVATVVRAQAATAAKAGAKAVVAAGNIDGFIGGACVQNAVLSAAREVLQSGRAKLIRVKPADQVQAGTDADGVEVHKSGCPSRGTIDIFIEPMSPPPLLCIAGASPVAVALAEQGAIMGYRVLAASADGADAAKFPAHINHRDAVDLDDAGIGENDYVVVATQGNGDLAALKAAVATPARYVSMVCSRAKAAALCEKLRDNGTSNERLSRLKAPAGLDIQAIEPREIALSIIAEIISRRRQNSRAASAQ